MNRVFLGLVPEEPAYSQVRELMREYSAQIGSEKTLTTVPHITVVPSILTDREEELASALAQQCKHIAPLQVQFEGVGLFENRGVVYLRVKHTPQLQRVHEQLLDLAIRFGQPRIRSYERGEREELLQRYGSIYVKEHYTPHMTVAETMELNRLRGVARTQQCIAYSTITFTHLSIVKKTDCWKVEKKIPFS